MPTRAPRLVLPLLACVLPALAGCGSDDDASPGEQPVPQAVRQILDKPSYRSATWGLLVVDLDTGQVIHDLNAGRSFLIGSVRKLFSVGLALDALGPAHTFRTPVHRRGAVDAAGVLAGDLVLVASGDLAMGGRTGPDGRYVITDLDHNEANALGNAQLAATDPLAGYKALAAQVAAAGIRRVTGEVIIDDRLFEPFDFRGEFDVTPIFVNDDVVDVAITPGQPGGPASVEVRPLSSAFGVQSSLTTAAAGTEPTLDLSPSVPDCIGTPGCAGTVTGALPADFVPPLTGRFPLVQTFRIAKPSNYARTVFIEALAAAGVSVDAPAVAPNPVGLLPPRGPWPDATRVAELVSSPYADHARHVMKVSYNIGADTSLVLFGLTRGARDMAGSLAAERGVLASDFGIGADRFRFIDGSGGGDTSATGDAVVSLLRQMSRRPSFGAFRDAQPQLGVDGSLSFVTDFAADPALAGARGQVRAKTGTYVEGTAQGLSLRAQTLAGYIDARSGRRLAFALFVNDVGPIAAIDDILGVFQDQGRISAMLWRDL